MRCCALQVKVAEATGARVAATQQQLGLGGQPSQQPRREELKADPAGELRLGRARGGSTDHGDDDGYDWEEG